jgi:hypothetical protein
MFYLHRRAGLSPTLSLRAAGGFGDKGKSSKSSKDETPVAKITGDEKAANPKQALDSDLEALRQVMGNNDAGSGMVIENFGDTAMEPSVPEKQVLLSVCGGHARVIQRTCPGQSMWQVLFVPCDFVDKRARLFAFCGC